MHSERQQIATARMRMYTYKKLNILQFATGCEVYANKFLPYAHCTLAIGYYMRSVR